MHPLSLIPLDEIEFSFMRSSGPGGQNVNKVETGVLLRFDVLNSSLSYLVKTRLIKLAGNKITKEGVLIIKANSFRTQKSNKEDALKRLGKLLKRALNPPKKRIKTKLSRSVKEKRKTSKVLQSKKKKMRVKNINI